MDGYLAGRPGVLARVGREGKNVEIVRGGFIWNGRDTRSDDVAGKENGAVRKQKRVTTRHDRRVTILGGRDEIA